MTAVYEIFGPIIDASDIYLRSSTKTGVIEQPSGNWKSEAECNPLYCLMTIKWSHAYNCRLWNFRTPFPLLPIMKFLHAFFVIANYGAVMNEHVDSKNVQQANAFHFLPISY